VHEAFLRLIDQDRVDLQGRTHFLGLAAMTMRRVLVDHARSKKAQKHGGGRPHETVDEAHAMQWQDPHLVLAVDEALTRLAQTHPRQAKVVELHFFGELTLEETGAALGIHRDTAKLDWRFARAWLNRALAEPDPPT
jgi:RNA polymerase sigma factor (TIGR02999 family)